MRQPSGENIFLQSNIGCLVQFEASSNYPHYFE